MGKGVVLYIQILSGEGFNDFRWNPTTGGVGMSIIIIIVIIFLE